MFYSIVRPLLMLFMLIFYPRKIYGKENLPENKDRLVIVCNHFGKIDVFFVGSIFKGKTYFLAKRELFEKKLYNKIIRSLGGIPVMRDSVDLGLTIDERIADGYYYSKTIRLMKKLLAEPELLERPLSEEVDY